MIPRRTLEIAAFWDQCVCLDCETIQPPDEASDLPEPDEPALCCSCSGTTLLPAEIVLQAADLVGEDE